MMCAKARGKRLAGRGAADRGEYRQAAGAIAVERYSGQLQSYQ